MPGAVTAALVAIGLASATPARGQAPPSVASPSPSTLPPATIDDSLEVTGEALAAREVEDRLTVEVGVNGQGPFRFLVDSGADRTAIGLGLARRLGLPNEGQVVLNDMVGRQDVGTVRIDRLTLGPSTAAGIVAPALPEPYIGAQGIVGIDALADQRVLLDFARRRVTVQDSRRQLASEPGEIVVVARRRHGQLILTTSWVGVLRLHAIIDSGSDVTIGNMALRARVARARRLPTPQLVALTSVTGRSMTAALVTVPELRIGDLVLQNVPIAFADVAPFALFGLKDEPALLLGTDVLRVFARVALDFRGRRVRFQPR